MEAASWVRGSDQSQKGNPIRRLVNLVGAQLLGIPAGDGPAAAGAAAPWWSARLPSAHRRPRAVPALDAWPEWQPAKETVTPAPRRSGGRSGMAGQVTRGTLPSKADGGVMAQEVGMMQATRITKFLELNGALHKSARSNHWFSLPGRWRLLPRFQLLRRQDSSGPVERDLCGGLLKLGRAGARQGG